MTLEVIAELGKVPFTPLFYNEDRTICLKFCEFRV